MKTHRASSSLLSDSFLGTSILLFIRFLISSMRNMFRGATQVFSENNRSSDMRIISPQNAPLDSNSQRSLGSVPQVGMPKGVYGVGGPTLGEQARNAAENAASWAREQREQLAPSSAAVLPVYIEGKVLVHPTGKICVKDIIKIGVFENNTLLSEVTNAVAAAATASLIGNLGSVGYAAVQASRSSGLYTVRSLELRVLVNSLEHPLKKIPIIGRAIHTKSHQYVDAREKLDVLLAQIQVIQFREQQGQAKN